MSVRAASHYRWRGWASVPSVPYLPPVPPALVPVQPGGQGERWRVRVAEFPSGVDRGVLWDAVVESDTKRLRELGPHEARLSVPATPTAMRILGDPIDGTDLYSLDGLIAREFLVGSDRAGAVDGRYVVRDEATVRAGRIEIPLVGFVGGLTSDRVIGAATRLNLLGGRGRFGSSLSGWTHVGPGTSGTSAGGVDGSGFYAWVKGTPGETYIEARVRWQLGEQPWDVRQWFAAQSYVWLPGGLDIDGYGLVSLGVRDRASGKVWWDFRQAGGDSGMGLVDESMPTGRWVDDGPVVAQGLLPRPPYDVDLLVRLHAVDETEEVRFDDVRLVRPENTSTGVERDLVSHPRSLFAHAQAGRGKSPWGITVQTGDETGTVELGRWMHEDGQTLDEALNALGGRGVEVWDLSGPGRSVMASARRGAVREDVVLNPWDVLGEVVWAMDLGRIKSAARASSAAASLWGGADEGAVDISQSRGQVIDVTLAGPAGMLPAQLVQWLEGELSSLALLPSSLTVLVSAEWARRVVVGDTLRVRARSGSAGLTDWMRVTQIARHHRRGIAAVDLGTDPELGGRS